MKIFWKTITEDGITREVTTGINRGMIFRANVPEEHTVGSEQYKRRPWLVVSADRTHQRLRHVVAVPLSTAQGNPAGKAQQFPNARILFTAEDVPGAAPGDVLPGVVLVEQVRVLAFERLDRQPMGQMGKTVMDHVDAALRFVLRLT